MSSVPLSHFPCLPTFVFPSSLVFFTPPLSFFPLIPSPLPFFPLPIAYIFPLSSPLSFVVLPFPFPSSLVSLTPPLSTPFVFPFPLVFLSLPLSSPLSFFLLPFLAFPFLPPVVLNLSSSLGLILPFPYSLSSSFVFPASFSLFPFPPHVSSLSVVFLSFHDPVADSSLSFFPFLTFCIPTCLSSCYRSLGLVFAFLLSSSYPFVFPLIILTSHNSLLVLIFPFPPSPSSFPLRFLPFIVP